MACDLDVPVCTGLRGCDQHASYLRTRSLHRGQTSDADQLSAVPSACAAFTDDRRHGATHFCSTPRSDAVAPRILRKLERAAERATKPEVGFALSTQSRHTMAIRATLDKDQSARDQLRLQHDPATKLEPIVDLREHALRRSLQR